MPDLRPVVEPEQVLTLLQQHFKEPINNLKTREGGQVAHTFAFQANGQEYILRFNDSNHMPISFAKEAVLSQSIASSHIPFPPVVQAGKWRGLYFAISQKVPGQMLTELPIQEVMSLLPEVITILDAIHHINVSQSKNYGIFDGQGLAPYSDWRSSLLQVKEEEQDWNYFGKWHVLFEQTFLERKLFDDIFARMVELLDYCPAERYLVHGDYNFRNILAHEGKITGVVDWINAQYSDFVYDIAGLDFWLPGLNMGERCLHYYQEHHIHIPFYNERLLCYECYIMLIAMRFFAKKGDEQAYQWICQRMQQLSQRQV